MLPKTWTQLIGVGTANIPITLPGAAAISLPFTPALNGDVNYTGGLSLVYDPAQSDWSQIRFNIVYGATGSVSNIKVGDRPYVPEPHVGGCDSSLDSAFNPVVGSISIAMIGGYPMPEPVPQWPGWFSQGPA